MRADFPGLRAIGAAAALAALGAAPAAAGKWHNHIDASMINEIAAP